MPEHCHTEAVSLWPPTFQNTSRELPCTDGQQAPRSTLLYWP
jgi:hypothetical protein